METDRYMIFCWGSYTKGTLRHLNNVPYEDVKTFVSSKGGIVYPNDVHA
jgi:hypothetical protein